MKFYVGLFVIALIAAITTSIYMLLEAKGAFDKKYSYHFSVESASSFSVGMPLKFSGFTVGAIDNIALNDDGSVFITFSVNQENRKWISKDSVLMVRKPLIGSAHIELYSAIGNEPLESGATLNILMSDDINDMVSKLEPAVNRVLNILKNVERISSYLARDDADLTLTLKNIHTFSAKLAQSDSLLTTITGDKEAAKSVVASLATLNALLLEIKALSASADEKLINPTSQTIQELYLIMKDVNGKLKLLDGTVAAIGSYDKDIITIKEQVNAGLQKSNQIMDKVDAILQDSSKPEVKLP